MTKVDAAAFARRLERLRSKAELRKYHRYFTFDEDALGDEDRFIGVRMGQVFALAKEFIAMPPAQIEVLLKSPVHEVRAGGCSIMDKQARGKGTTLERRKELYELYMRRHDRINSWDLVDLCCIHVVGGYLADKSQKPLYTLARSRNVWKRRTAIVSTAYYIRQGDLDDALKIALMLVRDKEDPVHKATGWMLRFAGDKDRRRLLEFLDKNAGAMPRVMLRNAIEHLGKGERQRYMKLKEVTR